MGLIKTGPFLFLTWVPSGNLRGVVVTSAVQGHCHSNLMLRRASGIVTIFGVNLIF